jgi:AcrR family transcriptional regulator
MATSLQSRKQEVVRDAIYDAGIDLFVRKGFDETTVEEVAQAAGVSRGSFFRYFATKDDLLARSVVSSGDVLISVAAACPAGLSSLELVRETALAGIQFSISQPRTRQIIEITSRSISARYAHKSRLVEVETRLSEVFAARIRNAAKDDLKPRMLAIVTLMVVDLTLASWFKGDFKDCSSASKQVFVELSRMFCGPIPSSKSAGAQGSRQGRSTTTSRRQLVAR